MICDPKSFQHITKLPPKNFNNRIKYQIYNQSAKINNINQISIILHGKHRSTYG